jgi:hypothetical protein
LIFALSINAQSVYHDDWLITPIKQKAEVFLSSSKKDVILFNGLVKRTFRITPNVACTGYENMVTGQQLLRSVKPEARITINNEEYNVGGLYGQKENGYLLDEWVDTFTRGSEDFVLESYTMDSITPFLKWKQRSYAPGTKRASGKTVSFIYKSPVRELNNIVVTVYYEIYDGIPLIVKWLTIENKSPNVITINRVVNEVLGLVEEESAVVGSVAQMEKQQGIYVETNYAFNNAMNYEISDQTTHWKADSAYTSQVNYNFQTPCLLEIYPEKVTAVKVPPGERFTSVRSYELLMDSYDRVRRGFIKKKMYRTIAPWTNQNPIFMHLVSKNDDEVKRAIDQCAATGYEAVILSFGSHLDMEDTSAANLLKWKALAAYAHNKKIFIGGYSLFSSRRISDEDDVIDSATGKPGGAFFGHAPCFGSKWGLAYRDKIKLFFTRTGFDIWENDGPYPGDLCASATHPGHEGLGDSQWKQAEIQKELYHWLNERGIYINAPDWYFLDGTNKIAIGYREVNFSLSRDQQKILNRQNIYDGTIDKTASMSWGFVPLTKYHGGGPDAVLEPLSEHLKDYQQLMMQYYGAGVQACYRGPRLYDTDETKKLVRETIGWYKKYRDILNSDMVPLRRADGRDWDGMMHANPSLKTKGLIMLYNPTEEKIIRTIRLPLYYTGLHDTATISERDVSPKSYTLNRDYSVDFTFTLDPESYSWFLIR